MTCRERKAENNANSTPVAKPAPAAHKAQRAPSRT